jgi:hypothetical protein
MPVCSLASASTCLESFYFSLVYMYKFSTLLLIYFNQNLDVNLAVNNLLSRDDEGEGDDDDSQDSYVPDDLISLLDSGMHPDHPSVIIDGDAMFSEDMFGYSSIRSRGSGARSRLGKQVSDLLSPWPCGSLHM